MVREGLSEEGTLSCRDQPWEVPPLHTGHPRAPAACGEEAQRLALQWGRGEAGRGFQKVEGGLLPPPPPGSLLPVASATFLPLGGQGMGARCIPVEIQEALRAACASLLQGPDGLLAGSRLPGAGASLRMPGVSCCYRACGHMSSQEQALGMRTEHLADKVRTDQPGSLLTPDQQAGSHSASGSQRW